MATGVWLGIDFGFRAPFICLWICEKSDGSVYVFDEYVQSARQMDEHIGIIASRPWPRARRIGCDPAGASTNEQTAMSNVGLLRKAGYIVKTRSSRIQEGLELIRAGLRPAAGNPRLFIHPRCQHLIRALVGYHYADDGLRETPVKDGEHDHLIDALRYFYVNRTIQTDPPRKY